MRFRARVEFVAIIFALLGSAQTALAAANTSDKLSNQRMDYSAAEEAILKGNWSEYKRLRAGLDDYPLAIYLDYKQHIRQLSSVTSAQADEFLNASSDTPLPNRFLGQYLNLAGKNRRWDDYLAVKPDEPNSIELKCYYFRARLANGDKDIAWEGAQRLWDYGKSRPKQCDPLFTAWLKSGQLTDAVVWSRSLKAFEARQRSLMEYVGRKASNQLKPYAAQLLAVYKSPLKLRNQKFAANSPYSTDIVSYGLAYLARYSPSKALDYWQRYQKELTFSPEQQVRVESAIVLQGLFAKTQENLAWLPDALKRLKDDNLIEIRLRWALSEQDWKAVEQTLPLLSAEAQQKTAWRYWKADVKARFGQNEEAAQLLTELAGERDYYGFLAADRQGMPYSFNQKSLKQTPANIDQVSQLPAMRRIEELYFHQDASQAHSEWYKVLQDAVDENQLQSLALYATQQAWYRMAIDAATKAQTWDALEQRFPTPFKETFKHYAAVQGVPDTELMSIARRESAFYPEARSPVGARGLMQVMPATGKAVAKSLGKSHSSADLYDVDHNVMLGSAYYRELLDRFDSNRIFALTGYNAGPHRVERWRHKGAKQVPVEIWVETIPYRETRNYVQAVLSYNVVFQHMLGHTPALLTPRERKSGY